MKVEGSQIVILTQVISTNTGNTKRTIHEDQIGKIKNTQIKRTPQTNYGHRNDTDAPVLLKKSRWNVFKLLQKCRKCIFNVFFLTRLLFFFRALFVIISVF